VADLTPATLTQVLGGVAFDELPVVAEPGRFGPPPAGIGKVVCIGLNYRDNAAETGAQFPGEPIVFLKTSDTVVGPDDEVLIPRRSVKTDHEVELAVVIGRQARYLADEEADRLRPEKEAEYRALHAAAWPGVLAALKQANIGNYSIFLRDGMLFSYLEYNGDDYAADMATIAADPVTQEWLALTDPCQQPLDGVVAGETWAPAEEIFHLE
jgi:L-rhamnose mutarotase